MPIRRRGRPGLIGLAAQTAVVAGTASAVRDRAARGQQERIPQLEPLQAPPAPVAMPPVQPQAQAAATAPSDGLIGSLQKLAELHAQGALTDAEFTSAKAQLLS